MTQTKTILKIVMLCAICAATMVGGCLEVDDPVNANDAKTEIARVLSESNSTTPTSEKISTQSLVDKYMNSVRSKYDKAQFDQSYMRDSDGFDLYYGIRTSKSYHSCFYGGDGRWQVNTHSTYPPYDNMFVEEKHSFSVTINHYDTIRCAHEKMVKGNDVTFEYKDDKISLENPDYGDQSYKYVAASHSNSDDPDEITGYSANIFILKDKTIGRIWISGYSDPDECKEVIDYYAPILAEVLENIE